MHKDTKILSQLSDLLEIDPPLCTPFLKSHRNCLLSCCATEIDDEVCACLNEGVWWVAVQGGRVI